MALIHWGTGSGASKWLGNRVYWGPLSGCHCHNVPLDLGFGIGQYSKQSDGHKEDQNNDRDFMGRKELKVLSVLLSTLLLLLLYLEIPPCSQYLLKCFLGKSLHYSENTEKEGAQAGKS